MQIGSVEQLAGFPPLSQDTRVLIISYKLITGDFLQTNKHTYLVTGKPVGTHLNSLRHLLSLDEHSWQADGDGAVQLQLKKSDRREISIELLCV
jgi:hypothetical protein